MTPAQIQRIRQSFTNVVLRLDLLSAAFCERLLRLDPSRAPFGGDPVVQRIKVGAARAGLVASLGQLDHIRPQLRAMGRERARQGVHQEDYARLGEALIGALQEALGENFDAETRYAWLAAYEQLALTMIGGTPEQRIAHAA